MTRRDFLAEIEKIVEAKAGTLKGDEPLSSVQGWDSMATMGFIAMCDSRLGIIVSPQKLAECRTLGDLTRLVQERLSD